MNHEEILANLKALTEEIKSKTGQLTEEDLGEFLNDVSESLGEVFNLAQSELNRGIQQIEVAQSCLKNENMHDEADSISPLLSNMQSVQNQLNIGLELSREKREFEGFDKEPKPERLLTPRVMETFQKLEKALERSR
ncbi:MAG TPA: hypothetical protein EYO33_02185 [Phycisphaerales bacterium]|nr:hypothetical protein [Phycisphaerales bacterium]